MRKCRNSALPTFFYLLPIGLIILLVGRVGGTIFQFYKRHPRGILKMYIYLVTHTAYSIYLYSRDFFILRIPVVTFGISRSYYG